MKRDAQDHNGRAEEVRTRGSSAVQAHPVATALAAGLVLAGGLAGAEQWSRPTLSVVEIASSDAPKLDGDLSDPVWTKAKPVSVLTTQGGDFGGSYQSLVEIRALHDGQYAYLSFVWDDPTRSLKHLPLVKRNGRWWIVASRPEVTDESVFHEDKLAVLLARPGLPLIGGAIHLSRRPLAEAPPSTSGRGMHFTDGGIADVWQWRASHGGMVGHIDNSHFGGPGAPASSSGSDVGTHYSGGFGLDPGSVPHQTNYVQSKGEDGRLWVVPRRLPRDPAKSAKALGRIGQNAKESEDEGSRWWMSVSESVAYSPALDAEIPDGTVIAGVVVADEVEMTRASIRGFARWAAGRWTLEVVRNLHTGSPYDVPIRTGVLMWVAAFDHAEMRHTRHLRPFRLEVE